MTSRQFAVRCARICDDKKATDVSILDVRKLTFITDYFVIASTRSDRQSRAIAEEIARTFKQEGVRELGREGDRSHQWILQDFGDVVMHLLLESQRSFYDIESLWADAPRVKWEGAARAPRRA